MVNVQPCFNFSDEIIILNLELQLNATTTAIGRNTVTNHQHHHHRHRCTHLKRGCSRFLTSLMIFSASTLMVFVEMTEMSEALTPMTRCQHTLSGINSCLAVKGFTSQPLLGVVSPDAGLSPLSQMRRTVKVRMLLPPMPL